MCRAATHTIMARRGCGVFNVRRAHVILPLVRRTNDAAFMVLTHAQSFGREARCWRAVPRKLEK